MKINYSGKVIRKSGQNFFAIYEGHKRVSQRFTTIEAAKAYINATGRVMTPAEHAIIYRSTTSEVL